MIVSLFLVAILQHPHAAPDPDPLPAVQQEALPVREDLRYSNEKYFGTMRRLTTQGENAEAYFNWAGDRVVYQATFGDRKCDQIYELDLLTGSRRLISTGSGRTTCSFYMPDDQSVIFSSTHAASDDCLPPADFSKGYVWKIYPEFELYIRDLETWDLKPISPAKGYDAEAVVSPDGKKIVFTSMRHGDLDIYTMNTDGTGLKHVTDKLGYDGGPFFSHDSKRIVYRSYYPETEEAVQHYRNLLATNSIEPMALQIRVMGRDGNKKVQVTDNGAANFGPFWHPDNKRIIYSSNQGSESGRDFDLFIIHDDGTRNDQVTHYPGFDGFPMFSHDGKRLIFASNRRNAKPGDTNSFITDWIERNLVE
jgi:TolB protein